MAVTRDEVLWAYRMILGREPESEAVMEGHLPIEGREALRAAFLNSDEFKGKQAFLPIGRFVDRSCQAIEVDCSREQLDAMLARIATEWQRFGESEPHWSVLVSDDYRSDTIAANIEPFYASGIGDVEQVLHMLRRSAVPAEHFGRVLDFGCGVGRLTLALARRADHVIGIDISPGHLLQAEQRAHSTGVTNIEFQAIASVDDLDQLRGSIDLVLSLIVLQHNPPPVMAELLGKLLDALAVGGVAIIQLPTYFDGVTFSAAEYLATPQPAMEMNALPQHHIFRIAEERNCRVLEVREDGRIGDIPAISHIFAVQRRA